MPYSLLMTTNHIDHSNCDHDRTSKARAACRKDRASGASKARDLIRIFNEGYTPRPNHWVFYAAGRFANYTGDDLMIAAGAVLAHFAPIDEATDANRRRNGYTVTDDIHTMLSITRRAAS